MYHILAVDGQKLFVFQLCKRWPYLYPLIHHVFLRHTVFLTILIIFTFLSFNSFYKWIKSNIFFKRCMKTQQRVRNTEWLSITIMPKYNDGLKKIRALQWNLILQKLFWKFKQNRAHTERTYKQHSFFNMCTNNPNYINIRVISISSSHKTIIICIHINHLITVLSNVFVKVSKY